MIPETYTYFNRGWYWDDTVQFVQFYGERRAAKFIVRMKPGFRFQDYV